MNNTTVIVVAAGKGLRMGSDLPKQFLFINNQPILGVTLRNIREALPEADIIVAMHPDYFEFWTKMCSDNSIEVEHRLVAGGLTRFESVRNCVDTLSPSTDIILVHDGVRPFVSETLIARLISALSCHTAVVPVIPIVDSLRRKNVGGGSEIVNRSEYVAVQTPQVFRAQCLVNSYSQCYNDNFTDDASVVESGGYSVELVGGELSNFKITTSEDMQRANFLLKEVCKLKK